MIKKLLITTTLSLGAFYFGQTTIFQENFEPATAALWGNVDRDGDGEKWEFLNAELNEVLSFQGGFAVSFSWYFEAFIPDNALISPEIILPNTGELNLRFKVAAGDEELFDEHYAVYVIPSNGTFTGSETPVYEETLDAGYTLAAKIVNVDLSDFKGQNVKIVLRHFNCTDIFYLGFDDVEVTQNSLAVSDAATNSVKIYPNPTSDLIRINNDSKVDFVRIFDLTGKIVKESKSTEIDVRALSAGQYILNVHSGNEITSQKFIKK